MAGPKLTNDTRPVQHSEVFSCLRLFMLLHLPFLCSQSSNNSPWSSCSSVCYHFYFRFVRQIWNWVHEKRKCSVSLLSHCWWFDCSPGRLFKACLSAQSIWNLLLHIQFWSTSVFNPYLKLFIYLFGLSLNTDSTCHKRLWKWLYTNSINRYCLLLSPPT